MLLPEGSGICRERASDKRNSPSNLQVNKISPGFVTSVLEYAVPPGRGGTAVPRTLILLSLIAVFFPVFLLAQASGDALFDAKCATCHGKDGAGKTAFAQKARIPNLGSPEVQSMSDHDIYDSIARGSKHKAYPHAFALRGMTQGEIESLVKRIREFGKEFGKK